MVGVFVRVGVLVGPAVKVGRGVAVANSVVVVVTAREGDGVAKRAGVTVGKTATTLKSYRRSGPY